MKILYFYQYFATPKGSWGTRVYEFAGEWVKAGHDVTVVTSVYSKSDLKAERFFDTQMIEGIRVKIINVSIDNKQSFLKRIASFVVYALASCWYALTLKTDIVIASSGPITVGLPGLVARYLRGRKLVFETRDLWPEGAIELGILKNRILIRLAYWFERTCYRASSLIVSLSPGMKKYIEEKHHHPNVISVTNSANIQLFATPQPFHENGLLKEKKYAIYTGNIGMVNNSVWLLNAARELKKKNREDIIILLIGEGQQREELEKISVEEDLKNFMIRPLIPKTELVSYVQHAFVSLVPLKGTPVLDTSSPNKFFESLAVGIPVIQNTQGWMKDFLEEHEVGYTILPDDALALAEKLIELDDNHQLLHTMSLKAMQIAKLEFDKTVLSQRMLTSLLSVHSGSR